MKNLLQTTAPWLEEKIDISEVPEDKVSDVIDLVSLNDKLILAANTFCGVSSYLEAWKGECAEDVEKGLDDKDKAKAYSMLDSFFGRVGGVSAAVGNRIKDTQSLIFDKILTKEMVTTLEAVQDFRKSIDSTFPNATDNLIAGSLKVLSKLASSYMPVVGAVLEQSKIVESLVDYLKVDNIDKNLGSLRQALDELEKDRSMKEIHANKRHLMEIAEAYKIDMKAIDKIGFSSENIKTIVGFVENGKNPKELLSEMGKYAIKFMPDDNKAIQASLGKIRGTIDKTLTGSKLKGVDFEELMEKVEEKFGKAEDLLKESKGLSFFDKLAKNDGSAKIIQGLGDDIAKMLGKNNKEIAGKVKDAISGALKENLIGDTSNIVSLTKGENKSLVKELGFSITKEVILSSLAQNAKGRSQGVSH